MPSFRSSPGILGAPQRGFAVARRATRALISAVTGGRPRSAGRRAGSSTHGSGTAAISGRCRESRSRGAVSTWSRPWLARPRKDDPSCEAGPGRRPLVHGELLTQGKVLDRELAVAAAEEREQTEQVEQESDH